MKTEIEKRELLIAEANAQIVRNMTDVADRLASDPEAEIGAIVQTILCQSVSRSTRIKEKRKLTRDLCDRYDRKAGCKDALA